VRIAADIIQLVGLVIVAFAVYLIWPPLGVLSAGVLMILVGVVLDPRISRRKD
jgi:hypothetical protein